MNFYVATQFTRKLGPRFIEQSPYHDTGQEFRDKYLIPQLNECIQRGEKLFVVFDGCSGAGVSFLEESFGGLIRAGIPYEQLTAWLVFVWNANPRKKAQAEGFIEKAYHDQQENSI